MNCAGICSLAAISTDQKIASKTINVILRSRSHCCRVTAKMKGQGQWWQHLVLVSGPFVVMCLPPADCLGPFSFITSSNQSQHSKDAIYMASKYVVMVDEYLTSQICSCCLTRTTIRQLDTYGLKIQSALNCQTCNTRWNCDHMASINIRSIFIRQTMGLKYLGQGKLIYFIFTPFYFHCYQLFLS